jgi:hypothetical protein
MAIQLDFPPSPQVGDNYTSAAGVVYQWNGQAWVIGFYDTSSEDFTMVGDVLDQVRTLLQDVDVASGSYRYSTDSIIANINMGLIEMYRLRPDIFLENDFVIPQFNDGELDADLVIEQQYVPALVFYATGLTQARDDEETQDARATGLMQRFTAMLTSAT